MINSVIVERVPPELRAKDSTVTLCTEAGCLITCVHEIFVHEKQSDKGQPRGQFKCSFCRLPLPAQDTSGKPPVACDRQTRSTPQAM